MARPDSDLRPPRALRRHALTLLTALAGGWCGHAHAINLTGIVQLARANDPQLAAARAQADAGHEKAIQGRAGLLPVIAANGSAKSIRESSTTVHGPTDYHAGTASISLTQPLLRKANYELFREGQLQSYLADLQLQLAEQDLVLRVAKAYFDVLQAQETLSSVRAQKDAFGQQLAQANKSFEVGVVPITDVNEAQARFDLTSAQEIAALNDLEVKRRTLKKSIHTDVPPLAALDEAAPIDLLNPDQMTQLTEQADQKSLAVSIGQTGVEIAQRELAKEGAGHWPTVDLVVNKIENYHGTYGISGPLSTRQATAGIEVSLPLFQGGAVSSRQREAAANVEKARADLAAARAQASFDASQAMLGLQSGSAMNRALKRAITSNELQLRSTRRGLEVGVRTQVDVLNAVQQLYATRKDLAAARYQTLLASLQLKAAAGQLGDDDLAEVDRLLKE
jgi:outer membrane protein